MKGVLGMAEFFKAMLGVLVLTAAAASGAEAVGVNWVPSSDRFGDEEVSAVKIGSALLLNAAIFFGVPLMVLIVAKVAEIGQDMLSFLWSGFRHRR